jgi:hypothetical protein
LTLPVTSTAGEDGAGYLAAGWLLFVCSPVGIALAIVAIA